MLLKLYNRFKKIDWRSGVGELIGFAICLPLIMILLCGLIMVVQLGSAKQTLEYATYSAARGAVVQETFYQAKSAAEAFAASALETGTFGVSNIDVQIETIGGTYDVSSNSVNWEKGSLMKCVVTIDVDTIAPFADKRMSSEIIMMVERPVPNPSAGLPPY